MKQVTTILFLFFTIFSSSAKSQTYTGAGGLILDNGQDNYFPLNISNLTPTQIDSTFGIEQVCFTINHPAVEELWIYLQSPAGNIVELTEGSSCKGANYTSTCFDSQLNSSITLGTTPYTGSYKPVGYLGRFNTGQAGNGTWNLIVHDGVPFNNSGSVISWSIHFGISPSHPVRFTSSNLPIVIVNTNSQTISDSKILVNMGIIDNGLNRNYVTDPWNNYNAKAALGIRGNSTKNFEKKAYSFETRDAAGVQSDVSILGMPIENDWDLIASYQDKTLMRIPMTYDLYRKMGHYASRFKNVEMIINNEYRGVYALTEKLKRDSSRIHVSKMLPTDNTYPYVTGGYILKIDRSDAPGWTSLLPGDSPSNSHFYYQYVYPKDSNITVQQQTYIKNYLDSFETVMASPNFADPTNGYPKYIHTGSFVDFFIVNELSKNVDAYRLSTYMYKDNILKGGKLHIGPVWDYDIAWHNCNYANAFDYNFWQYQTQDTTYPAPTWWSRLMQDTNFVDDLHCRWLELRQNVLSISSLNNYIDSTAAALNESQQRNFTQWPILGAYIWPNPQNQTGATYQGEVNDLKTWIANRIGWMDANMPGHCLTGIEENNVDYSIAVYPNPFQSTATFDVHLIKDANVSLKIIDMMGKEIAVLLNEHKSSGEFKIPFDREQIPAGMYFYQLKINGTTKTGKIITQ